MKKIIEICKWIENYNIEVIKNIEQESIDVYNFIKKEFETSKGTGLTEQAIKEIK